MPAYWFMALMLLTMDTMFLAYVHIYWTNQFTLFFPGWLAVVVSEYLLIFNIWSFGVQSAVPWASPWAAPWGPDIKPSTSQLLIACMVMVGLFSLLFTTSGWAAPISVAAGLGVGLGVTGYVLASTAKAWPSNWEGAFVVGVAIELVYLMYWNLSQANMLVIAPVTPIIIYHVWRCFTGGLSAAAGFRYLENSSNYDFSTLEMPVSNQPASHRGK